MIRWLLRTLRWFGRLAVRCEWYQCEERGTTFRTDLGGTTTLLCADHAQEGDDRGYHREYGVPE